MSLVLKHAHSPAHRLVLGLALILAMTGPPAQAAAPVPSDDAAARSLPARLDLAPDVDQLITVTSRRWSATRGSLRVWTRRGDGWQPVRGPVRVVLGWSGWARAQQRRQSTGTTPAGRFGVHSAFGLRTDPGTDLAYRRVDRNDHWPYEPRDPATYNIYQERRSTDPRWRTRYAERLSDYGYEYAYSVVLGYNLPDGVHWSPRRRQWVATRTADTERGGGIFLHVRKKRYTAGCVAAPLREVRWIVRWLDPDKNPRVVMGPRRWLLRRY